MAGFPALPVEDARTISGSEIESLNAGQIRSGTISAQKIILSDNADSVLQSGNYVAGSAGWQVLGDGDAEFNNVTVRGTIVATAGELGDLDVTGTLTVGAGGSIVGSDWSIDDTKIVAGDTADDAVVLNPSAWGADTAQLRLVTGGYPSAGGEELLLTLDGSGPTVTLQLNRSGSPSWPIFELGSGLVTIGTKSVPTNLEVNAVRAGDGSAAAPAFTFTSDTDTGMYRSSANLLAFTAGGVDVGLLGSSAGSPSIVRFPAVYSDTTASAANVHVTSAGELERSTSSARYKAAIRPWDHRSSVLDLTPSLYRSKASADDARRVRFGLIAEDVAEHFPLAAVYDEAGKPDAIDWNSIVAGLIAEVQTLRKELADAD